MGLESLIVSEPLEFSNKYSTKKLDQGIKTKLASTDIYEPTILALKERLEEGTKKDFLILANAGGGDSVLSLYSQVESLLKSKNNDANVNMIVMDRKKTNINQTIFRALLTKLAGDSVDYTNLLIGYKENKAEHNNLDLFGELTAPANIFELLERAKKSPYDIKKHRKVLHDMLETKHEAPEEYKIFFSKLINDITSQQANEELHSWFLRDIEASLKKNPETHYILNNNMLPIKNIIDFKNKKFNMHWVNADISSAEGIVTVRKVLADFGISKIDLAYIPHLMKSMPLTVPFLKDHVDMVIYSQRDTTNTPRYWILKDTNDLPTRISTPGLEKYDKLFTERKPLNKVSEIADANGVPKTLFLSNLSIGYVYSDRKTLESVIDWANAASVKNLVIGGGIYGTFFFKGNARRELKHPDFYSLDDQLKELKRVVNKFQGNVTYITVDNDKKIIDELVTLYDKENRRRITGKPNISYGIHHMREEYNSRLDAARFIVRDYVYPYILRLGEDVTRFHNEDVVASNIVELVDIFTKIHENRELTDADKQFIEPSALANSTKFSVVPFYRKDFDKDGVQVGMRVMPSTRFSNITQYKEPSVVLEEKIKMARNGAIKDITEQLFIDIANPQQMLKLMGKDAVLFAPHMVDDSRYEDPDFIPESKQIREDPVHKRVTIRRDLNFPGGWIYTGDIKDRLLLVPIFPKMLENMEKVQKSGKGYPEVSVFVYHDLQLNSLSERPDTFIQAIDYAMMEKNCTYIVGVGDFIQGRNYPGMPVENAVLGGLTTHGMQMGFVELVKPYMLLPQVKYIGAVPGNHEWNSDKFEFGNSYITAIETFVKHAVADKNTGLFYDFPEFGVTHKGDLLRVPYLNFDINGYGILAGHMYAQRGSGSGTGARPTTHIASWMRNVGGAAKTYDIGWGAHYHIVEMMVRDNKFVAINGAYAGGTGYEFMRQIGGGNPMAALYHFKADGSFQVELLTEAFLKTHQIKHPDVKSKGVEQFINDAFKQYASPLTTTGKPMQKLWHRDIERKDPMKQDM